MRAFGWMTVMACVMFASSARAESEIAACVPGKQVACACAGGTSGFQRCKDSGAAYEACECAPTIAPAAAPSDVMPAPGEIPKVNEDTRSPFGFHIAAGAAIDNAALATIVAARVRYDSNWIFGADAEWNPWISFETKRARPGALNFYGTVIRRYPVSKWVSLRTSAHIGVSTLLFSLYGAPAGSFGPYFGVSLIGLEFMLSKTWKLIVDPSDVIYAVPHLTGAPLLYRQYRFTIGLQFGT
jgi:hypothetical protein